MQKLKKNMGAQVQGRPANREKEKREFASSFHFTHFRREKKREKKNEKERKKKKRKERRREKKNSMVKFHPHPFLIPLP